MNDIIDTKHGTMKKIIGILILMLSGFMSFGQNLMTIREVFDFEVGDKFHMQIESNSIGNGPNGGERLKVVQKTYSSNQDTLIYKMVNDSYSIGYPLIYFFSLQTTTLVLTNLDSLISKYDTNFTSANSIFFNSLNYCNTLTNSWQKFHIPGEEEVKTYGKGLGLVYSKTSSMMGTHYTNHQLVYYSKNGVECGTPDLTGVGIEDLPVKPKGITLYPQPVSCILTVSSDDTINRVEVLNQSGQPVRKYGSPYGNELIEINVQDLTAGLYILHIIQGNQSEYRKIIKY